MNTMQELSYRKQIVSQLHTQYVEGIYRPKYYIVIRDLEMWVRGHSRLLKMVPFESLVRFPIRLP